MIKRELEDILISHMNNEKIIIILGPRQVGKTTLLKMIQENTDSKILWLNGDEPDIRNKLSNKNSQELIALIGNSKLIIIDEAQRIENIGITLKLIYDNIPDIQLLVSGSSSFELVNTINEPLTGRKYEYHLFPFSFNEMQNETNLLDEQRLIEHRMIYGWYPDIVNHPGQEKELLAGLCNSYLYKDLFALHYIKKPLILEKLLLALAIQLGNEVNYNELSQLLNIDIVTVEKYIDLLEKSFVIFKLPSLNRNMRNEIKRGRKIYFYDNGIRNTIIKNYNPLNMRLDTGGLWENFCIAERMKYNHYRQKYVNRYFWRTFTQNEIDYIEEYDGKLYAFEFKWNVKKKVKIPKAFKNHYPNNEFTVITPENLISFITNNN